MKSFSLWLSLLLLPLVGFNQDYGFVRITAEDGLPSNECYDLLQDQHGFIWIATDRGLSRYDGQSFKNFSVKDGLLDNLITQLRLDPDGRLWCNNFRRGLTVFDSGRFSSPEWMSFLGEEVSLINDFVLTRDGSVHVGFEYSSDSIQPLVFASVSESGVEKKVRWPADSGHFVLPVIIGDQHIIGYAHGGPHSPLYVRDTDRSTPLNIYPNGMKKHRAAIHREMGLYFASGQTLYHIRDGTVVDSILLEGEILDAIETDSRNRLWVGTAGRGAYVFPNGDLAMPPERALDGKSVTSVMEDRNGDLWFSTLEEGVFYLPYERIRVYEKLDQQKAVTIQKAALGPADLWLAFRHGQLYKIPLDTSVIEFQHAGNYDYIYDMAVDTRGQLILGCGNPERKSGHDPVVKPMEVSSVQVLKDSSLLFSLTNGGLFKERGSESEVKVPAGQELPRIYVMESHPDGSIWLGGLGGLYRFADEQLQSMQGDYDLFSSRVTTIATTLDMTLVGLSGNGLIVVMAEDTLHLHSGNVLFNDFINAVEPWEDYAFIASSGGIDLLDLSRLPQDLHARHLGAEMGLPGNKVNDLLVARDSLWVFSDAGMVIIPLSDILTRQSCAPSVYYPSILVNGKAAQPEALSQLKYDQNNVQIRFQPIHHKNASSVQSFYRLLGSNDSSWQPTNEKLLNLVNLSPGDYRLEMKVTGGFEGGVVHEALKIHVSAPYWQRWYFISGISVLALLAVSLLALWRIRSVQRSARLEAEVVRLTQKSLRAQMNPHFIYNSMNAIQQFIVTHDMNASLHYLGKLGQLMRSVFRNSSEELIPLENEVTSLQCYVELEQARYPGRIQFSSVIDPGLNECLIPPLILQPFIENAIIHGILPREEGGNIKLSAVRHEKFIELKVQDDGIGMEESELIRKRKEAALRNAGHERPRNVSGLKVTRLRIDEHVLKYGMKPHFKALDLKQQGESGTQVSFRLPLLQKDQ